MKIHEFQAKELFRNAGIPVPEGSVAHDPEQACEAAGKLGGFPVVVKAQIHAGGRGKGGGVKLAQSADEVQKIAQEIIDRRRTKPFKDIDDLKQALFRYGESIRKCEDYITTASDFFTVRITSVSGVAEASAIIAITKQGGKVQRIGIISG